MTASELSVIVTTHNREDLVEDTLASLAEQEWDGDWDILLVDNDSTDATPEILERWADKMPAPTRILHADERPSICYVRNTAVEATDATSIVFIDDDDVVGQGFVAAMGTALREHEFIGASRDLAALNSADEASYRGGEGMEERNDLFGVPIVPGGGCGCRRDVWLRLGGNDEDLGYGAEDAGLSIAVYLDGIDTVFVDDAPYHVRHRTTVRSAYRQGVIFAVAHVLLVKRHRAELGIHADPLGRVMRGWAGLVRRLPMLRRSETRAVWMWQLGRRVGRIKGSITERTWYP